MESRKPSNHRNNSRFETVTERFDTKLKVFIPYFGIQNLVGSLSYGNIDDLTLSFF